MICRKYIDFNTLKGDSWISRRFYLLPSLNFKYDRNSINTNNEDSYCKEFSITFEFLFIYISIDLSWDEHNNLN